MRVDSEQRIEYVNTSASCLQQNNKNVNDRSISDTIFRMKCLNNDGNTEFCLMNRLDLRKVFTSISTAKIHVLNYLMDDNLSGSTTLVVFFLSEHTS